MMSKLPASILSDAMLKRSLGVREVANEFSKSKSTIQKWMTKGVPPESAMSVAQSLDKLEERQGGMNVDMFEARSDDPLYAWIAQNN